MDRETNKEKLYEQIERAGLLLQSDSKPLKELLGNKVFLRALGSILDAADNLGVRLLQENLATPEGIAHAQKLQGTAAGLTTAVEMIIDAALDNTTNTEETTNG